jgi:hypothetical protein
MAATVIQRGVILLGQEWKWRDVGVKWNIYRRNGRGGVLV